MRRHESEPEVPEVLLEPFERVEVEVVGRLVEQEQVRLGDDQPGERGAGLLAAGQRGSAGSPIRRAEPEPGQAARRAGRACSRRGPRTRAAGPRRPLPSRARRARARPGGPPSVEVGGTGRTAVCRSGEAMNASSKCASWARSPRESARFRWTSPRSGSSRPAARRSSVVLPAPFGPTSPIRSPSAMDASTESRITKVPTSRLTPENRRMLISRPADGAAAARRVAAGAFVRSVRAGLRPWHVRRAEPERPPRPSPRSSAGPPGAVHRSSSAGSLRATCTVSRPEALAPRAEVGRPRADDDPLDRAAAARHGSPVRW